VTNYVNARSYDEFINVLHKLSEVGLDENTAVRLKESLIDGKQYLKGDYKIRIMVTGMFAFYRNYILEYELHVVSAPIQLCCNNILLIIYSGFMSPARLPFLIFAERLQ